MKSKNQNCKALKIEIIKSENITNAKLPNPNREIGKQKMQNRENRKYKIMKLENILT